MSAFCFLSATYGTAKKSDNGADVENWPLFAPIYMKKETCSNKERKKTNRKKCVFRRMSGKEMRKHFQAVLGATKLLSTAFETL